MRDYTSIHRHQSLRWGTAPSTAPQGQTAWAKGCNSESHVRTEYILDQASHGTITHTCLHASLALLTCAPICPCGGGHARNTARYNRTCTHWLLPPPALHAAAHSVAASADHPAESCSRLLVRTLRSTAAAAALTVALGNVLIGPLMKRKVNALGDLGLGGYGTDEDDEASPSGTASPRSEADEALDEGVKLLVRSPCSCGRRWWAVISSQYTLRALGPHAELVLVKYNSHVSPGRAPQGSPGSLEQNAAGNQQDEQAQEAGPSGRDMQASGKQ
jgi:hypothetical protein